jgi:hypothetical protein
MLIDLFAHEVNNLLGHERPLECGAEERVDLVVQSLTYAIARSQRFAQVVVL